jgi:hypothetical protein
MSLPCCKRKETPVKIPLKPFDIPVLAAAAALTLAIAVAVYSGEAASSRVIVRSPDKTWLFPLNAEERITVKGSIGETRIEIHNGRAAIVSSPCGGQICVAAGALHRNGQWVACLPNRIFLLIEGAKDTVDATAW